MEKILNDSSAKPETIILNGNSNSTKRALLIGINYFGTRSELRGCHNDVDRMYSMLLKFGYSPSNISVLKDSKNDPQFLLPTSPTRANIMENMKKLAQITAAGDVLFVHYSGHGYYQADQNGDDSDGRDEMICPVDTPIIDDELHVLLVESVPLGAKVRCVFDSCHSGTILDATTCWQFGNKTARENTCANGTCAEKDVLVISGCLDTQTSADAYIQGKFSGALTWGLCESIEDATYKFSQPMSKTLTWKDLMYSIRFKLDRDRYEQVPQLSYCRNILKSPVDL